MLFNSIDFLLFLPIVVIIYFILPGKVRYIWLLLASYYFYMNWNPQYAFLILLSTVLTYICGLALNKIDVFQEDEKKKIALKKCCMSASLIINLGILVFFKYLNFITENINNISSKLGLNLNIGYLDVLLPVGISFYTFQAIGYTIDVYRGTVKAEKNFFRYALFVSFFPQLVAGPIERTLNLMGQLSVKHRLSFKNFRKGVLWMLWGYFLKLVIADRVAMIVDTVYDDPQTYPGFYIIVATILFAIQIYCDFNGYTMIARGSAKIMGINLMENFSAPYLAQSVSEFWRRWHISLSSWFKDYLYIPLGGNRKGKIRKYINLLIVFFVSGLWHGAAWGYVIWGGLNGLYQVIGELLVPLRKKVIGVFRINVNTFSHKLWKTITTFLLIDFTWIFFRAKSISESKIVFENMIDGISFQSLSSFFDGSLYQLGLGEREFYFMLLTLAILLAVDYLKYKKVNITEKIMNQGVVFNLLTCIVLFWIVFMMGIYGAEYDASQFIYFQF